MEWLSQNWFFLVVLIAFVLMHLVGHGHHGGSNHSHHSTGADAPDRSRPD